MNQLLIGKNHPAPPFLKDTSYFYHFKGGNPEIFLGWSSKYQDNLSPIGSISIGWSKEEIESVFARIGQASVPPGVTGRA